MPKKPAATFCTLAQGTLILANIDFVMRGAEEASATVFDLPETHFHARDCTFSIAGKSKDGVALVRRHAEPPGNAMTRTWLQHCCVRGADVALLRVRNASSEVFLEDSLIVGYQYPMIQIQGRADDSLILHCVRSSLVTGQILLRWRTHDGKPAAPKITVRSMPS